jgi:CheY-like chemotaxis protein
MMTKILVVDDEEDLKILIKQRFRQKIRKQEYDFIFAENGRHALEQLAEHKDVDLILSDINMPEMDGWEFLAEYNQLSKEIQSQLMIVMLTTSDNSEDEARALAWNCVSGFITKPLTKEMMEDIYRKYIKLNLPDGLGE